MANEPGSRRAPTDTEGWAAGAIRSVAAIRHVAFEDLGFLEPLLRDRGATIRYFEAGVDELSGSAVDEADLLVVLGGPIGVYEDEAYPFLRQEIASVERRLAAGKPTLGICLGSQIMARALGARVFPSGTKEVGWGTIELTPAGQRSPLSRLKGAPVLHWHGDTFDLPQGATLLASTEVCRHQAFQWGGAALGLQFHVEVTATGLERWFIGHTAEISSTPGLSVAALRRDSAIHTPALARRGGEFIGHWLDALSPG